MKKVTLVAIATLTLLLTGCSQQEADTDRSQEQSTEQVSSSSEISTSSTSSSDALQGRSAYDVFVENFKAWVHDTDSTATVTSTEKDIAITLAIALTDEQIQKAQPMVDGMLKIKQSGEEELRKHDPNFKAPNLIVLDVNAKVIAQEQDGKMILDK
jgi:lipoprotein|nr:MAG TPA: outer membrane protein assembly factor [Caudoviricetes sp.]